MASTGDTWRRAALTASFAASLAAASQSPVIHDTVIAENAGRLLLHGHLDLYAQMPEAQMGPLALLVAAVTSVPVYLVLVCAMLPVALHLATAGVRTSRASLALLAGGLLLALPWSFYASEGHADDALVAVGVVGMLWGLRRNQRAWVVAAFVVAVAAKPTAIMFLPLVFFAGRRATVAALGIGGLVWAPFVLADPAGFIHAGAGVNIVTDLGLPGLLGAEPGSAFPAWVRPAQLVGGALICWWGYRRAGAPAVAAVWAFRALLEPVPYASYSTAVIFGAVILLALGWRWLPGVVAVAAAVATWVMMHGLVDVLPPLPGALTGWLRVACLLAVLVAVQAFTFAVRRRSVADRLDLHCGVEVAV